MVIAAQVGDLDADLLAVKEAISVRVRRFGEFLEDEPAVVMLALVPDEVEDGVKFQLLFSLSSLMFMGGSFLLKVKSRTDFENVWVGLPSSLPEQLAKL